MWINVLFAASFWINAPVANLQAEPDTMSEIVSQAIYATPILVISQNPEWSYVETPDIYRGWVRNQTLINRQKGYPESAPTCRVKNIWTHLCWVPDTTPHPPVLTVPYGTRLEVLSTHDSRWFQARLLDGTCVYGQCADFDFRQEHLTMEEMLTEAHQFIGLPYLWGGASGFGFDCSGFVQTLFRQMGIYLPRDAKQQAKYTQAIPLENLERGDLLFFGKNPEKVTHVGLYLGEGAFLHAVTTNKTGPHVIQLSQLKDPEWESLYLSGGRVNRS